MTRIVDLPPQSVPDPSGMVEGGWWHSIDRDNRIVCDLCPRECNMKPGDRGFCFVRQNVEGQMKLTTYGRSTGFCIDPVEKKPLNHFYPGTPVLSFGTAGCNLGCQFCQNWDISKSREVERLSELALPETIAVAAHRLGCRSVAFTYNDPIIWAEYAIDAAAECRRLGIKSIAVTAGYISRAARPAFFHAMDAANVDLKAFTEDFYQRITYSHLQPVLDTLTWLKHESDVWFEITNLVIPDLNDSPDELRQMCDWILERVGADVPVHFSAFHPDFRMTNRSHTPPETLLMAHEIAKRSGLNFAYVGNVHDPINQSTYCPNCKSLLIERNWYQLGRYRMLGNLCGVCGTTIAGHFDQKAGTWGQRRQPIRIGDFVTQIQSPKTAPTSNVMPPIVPVQLQLPVQSPGNSSISASQTKEIASQHPKGSLSTGSSTVIQKSTNMQPVRTCPVLTPEQEIGVHEVACQFVLAAVQKKAIRISNPVFETIANTVVMGVFVTLKRNGQLRGCCGMLGQPMALMQGLAQSAARTATEDHRFPPVALSELSGLTLDVTLLFNFEPITATGSDRIGAVEIGRHGLRIQQGQRAGLLLPSVATEHRMDSKTFLEQVCRKAGLPSIAWLQPDAHLERFEGKMIEGPFRSDLLDNERLPDPFPVPTELIAALDRFARDNVRAHFRGAVPACFPSNIPDGTVDGIALQLLNEASESLATFSRLQFQGGLPMQSTLLQLTQTAAEWLQKNKVNDQGLDGLKVQIALFAEPVPMGSLQSANIDRLDTKSQAIVINEPPNAAWSFDRNCLAKELLNKTVSHAQIRSLTQAVATSFRFRSNAAAMWNSTVAQPQKGSMIRPAAVAGTFYPADPVALAAIVDECVGEIPAIKEHWPAVMVPHAGLIYSGRIAASVLKRIQIPESVIIIGPKHTSLGVPWAVASNEMWQLPGATVRSDMALAGMLVSRIDGLQFDSVAHARDHAIEVELPLIARLSPDTRIVGILIGSGDLEQCQRFGQQLASVLSGLPSKPLLLISSDMNHFASDARNRELDAMAMEAMQSLDPQSLLDTVRSHKISMCGVLPAVIVMEALRCLGQLIRIERSEYATSADVSGDKSRVVGYAGMLLGPSPTNS